MLRHLSFILFATMCLSAVPAIAGTTTLENLQTAYNGESNAHSRYLAFAKQASLEGYGRLRVCSVPRLALKRFTPRITPPYYEGSGQSPKRNWKHPT